MAFFNVKKDEQALRDGSSGEYIQTSGVYDITIDLVSVKQNDKGARSLNFNYDYKGSKGVIYGLKLDNNDGSANFQRDIFNKLCVVCGIDSVDDPELQTHNIGKDNTPTDLQVLTQFSDTPIKAWIAFSYHIYNGEIREQREFRNFYRASDGATAREIVNNLPVGEQLAKDAKYFENIKYADGLTAEDVAAWKASKSGNNTAPKVQAEVKTSAFADNPF